MTLGPQLAPCCPPGEYCDKCIPFDLTPEEKIRNARQQIVLPDGPTPCDWAIVGEAPAREECEQGRGFVGPSGRIIWPLVDTYAGLKRPQVYVTNLCKHPLDNDVAADAKLSPEEFEECTVALLDELSFVEPKRVLALGSLAAKALLGDDYTVMEACTGSVFSTEYGYEVVPGWHPAAALRPGGEDKLQHTAVAVGQWRHGVLMAVPKRTRMRKQFPSPHDYVAIDTEGTPDSPRMLSWATRNESCVLTDPADFLGFFHNLPYSANLIFHNALWDWSVLRAMGWGRVREWPYVDTMERAHVRGEPSQGLKNLAWRYLRRKRQGYEDVVRPHWEERVKEEARKRVGMGTTVLTHSPKTGRLLKKPKIIMTDDVKPLHRAINNPDLLAERLGMPLDMKYVPAEIMEQYAIQDAEDTYDLAVAFGMIP